MQDEREQLLLLSGDEPRSCRRASSSDQAAVKFEWFAKCLAGPAPKQEPDIKAHRAT